MAVETLVDLFTTAVREHPRADMFAFKRDGEWHRISSDETLAAVRELSEGLASVGLKEGEHVAILSQNRLDWILADQAILRLKGVVVTLYPTLLPSQVEFILCDSEASAIFVEDEQQLEKVESVRARCPKLRTIISFESIHRAGIYSLQQLRELGLVQLERHPEEADARGRGIEPTDLATLIYTSGTTGDPKGVMLSHRNIVSNVINGLKAFDLGPSDRCLSFLPLSHVLERTAGYYIMVHSGVGIAFAESIETVAENMGEVRPTVMISVPRLYEKIYSRVLALAVAGSAIKRGIFFWAKATGEAWVKQKLAPARISPFLAAKKSLADRLVFRKLRMKTGGRLRFFISGGAPLAKEIAEFFYAAGMVIYEGYGLTETSPVIAVNNAKAFRPGTVGPPISGVEVEIAQDGEILTRSPSVMMGYWKRPEDTAEVLIDGWLHTGDIGQLSEDGFLQITDRKKDIIVTAGGKNVAPQPIENEIKLSRYVTEACLIGDKRKYIVALLVPNFESLDEYAARNELRFEERRELLNSSPIQGLFQHLIDKVNQNRPSYEQVKYFRLLDHEFSQEEDELTPSMKVKRRVIQARYAQILEEMYAGEEG